MLVDAPHCRKNVRRRGAVLLLLITIRTIPAVEPLLTSNLSRGILHHRSLRLQSRIWERPMFGTGLPSSHDPASISSIRKNVNSRVQEILTVLASHENRSSLRTATGKLSEEWSKTKNYLYNRHDLSTEQVYKVLRFLDDGR